MEIGNTVRKSGYALKSARDYWLLQGEYSRKQRAKEQFDALAAMRGTVIEILAGDPKRWVSPGLKIQWSNGTVSQCLDYMVELVKE
jgi:hypothetical protein